jgi:hypothetical protein
MRGRICQMKVLVLPKPRAGVAREALLQHAAEEIQAVWDLYSSGICREFYGRASEPGRVVLMLESVSEVAARDALATLPFARLELIDFDVIPLAPFVGLTQLFKTAS